MSRRATLVLSLAIVCAFAGCKARPDAKSVSFYMAHPVEREQLLATCKATEAVHASDADCTNAGKAWLARWVLRPGRRTAASAPP
jgi:hypothetical protein